MESKSNTEKAEKYGQDAAAYMTIKEASMECRVSEKTIRNWASRGIIDSVRLGPRVLRVFPGQVSAMLRK